MINVRKLTGQQIGNYALRELYGAGGMGAVYRAHQINLERDVAFKVMNLHYSDDSNTPTLSRSMITARLTASCMW
jgi:serine/threonine protein kinase